MDVGSAIQHITTLFPEQAVLFWWFAAASVLVFLASLAIVPMIIVRIPQDYFIPDKRKHVPWVAQHPAVRIVLVFAKNIAGGLFVVTGVAMLVLPGQGIVTILIGVMLLDFPGKFRLERWIVAHRAVWKTINWIRGRAGRPPLRMTSRET